jgi:AcrR family transcriptional regulator
VFARVYAAAMNESRMEQLPRGRHGLPREAVLASQRGRMVVAMADAVAERGFARTSVADVIRLAGVSRETFYEHFDGKEDCFLAAFDAAVELVITAVSDGYREVPDAEPADRVGRALTTYLETLAAEPAFARTFLVEVFAAGRAAQERRVAVQQRFVETAIGLVGARSKRDRFACEAVIAAVSSLVTMRVCAGRTAELPELAGPITELAAALFPGRA